MRNETRMEAFWEALRKAATTPEEKHAAWLRRERCIHNAASAQALAQAAIVRKSLAPWRKKEPGASPSTRVYHFFSRASHHRKLAAHYGSYLP